MEHVYDPAADRFDVAMRVVVGLATGRMHVRGLDTWDILHKLGLNRKEHELALLLGLDSVDSLRTDAGLACLLRVCPFILPAALELLRMYYVVTSESKYSFYHTGSSIEMETSA